MTNLNFIAAIIIIIACAAILGIKIYKSGDRPVTIQDFIDTYGDNIINILKDIIDILTVDMGEFETKEDYEEAVIKLAITAIKENSTELGIPSNVVNLFDTDSLASAIRTIFIENKCNIMSILDVKVIKNYVEMMTTE